MVIYFEQIDSTNRVAKELVGEGKPAGTVVWAGRQSSGKGQYGRTFDSPVGGLYFSLLLQPPLPLEYLSLVTLATGLACHDVIHSFCNLQTQIKWPNDIYLGEKKVAGILCENVILNSADKTVPIVVIGIGLNVNNTVKAFPIETQSIVTTLFEHFKAKIEIKELLFSLVTAITQKVLSLGEDRQEIFEQWQRYDYLFGKKVRYSTGQTTWCGIGCGITSEGFYCIKDYDGIEHRIVGGQLRLHQT